MPCRLRTHTASRPFYSFGNRKSISQAGAGMAYVHIALPHFTGSWASRERSRRGRACVLQSTHKSRLTMVCTPSPVRSAATERSILLANGPGPGSSERIRSQSSRVSHDHTCNRGWNGTRAPNDHRSQQSRRLALHVGDPRPPLPSNCE